MPVEINEKAHFSKLELMEAAHMEMLLGIHAMYCNEHHPNQKRGVVGIAPGHNFMICAWCQAQEPFIEPMPAQVRDPNPPTPQWIEDVQPWVHRLLNQLHKFYDKHLGCFPDPKYGTRAKLAATRTQDGLMNMADHVSVGKRYTIFPNTIRNEKWTHLDHPGKAVERRMVWAEDDPPGTFSGGQWLPLELLEVEGQA